MQINDITIATITANIRLNILCHSFLFSSLSYFQLLIFPLLGYGVNCLFIFFFYLFLILQSSLSNLSQNIMGKRNPMKGLTVAPAIEMTVPISGIYMAITQQANIIVRVMTKFYFVVITGILFWSASSLARIKCYLYVYFYYFVLQHNYLTSAQYEFFAGNTAKGLAQTTANITNSLLI